MFKEGKSNYLKYYRVIKQFIKIKWKLREDRLDILLFLYSEDHFDRQKVKEYESILTWDKNRWYDLMRDGWIVSYRPSKHHLRRLYRLSAKSIYLIENFYKWIEGEEIPMSPTVNPAFKRNVSYTDKVYRTMIKTMNSYIYTNRRMKEEGLGYPDLDGVYD